ncbi:MAG TPA: hypothetical protein VMO26_05500 [Vicinamibacterales bacterium]|nr:hypothetical protein [Vicinamibacterales bacterium]
MSRRFRLLRVLCALALLNGLPAAAAAQTARADLARARTAYNQREFDEAIIAAAAARRSADTADAAAIVLARAHLERYRERADPADLSAARLVLGSVRTGMLDARDEVELLLALGEALFLEDDFGAAAEVLESGVARARIDPTLVESMLEWWGSALERQASGSSLDARRQHYARLAERMKTELSITPSSPAANYWIVVGLRGSGEVHRAWDAAVAAWVRARLAGQRSATLRADLDHLVVHGVIPDRVRHIASGQRAAAESQLRAEWELVKERWK